MDITPSPARLVESLRDTGYTFITSVADIVDNSIAADATEIHIDIILEVDGNLKLYVADNGKGMSAAEIVNSLKYGSKKRTNPKSLGKFGMGLKTASTSFCRSLAVYSRANGELNVRTLDLDEIIKNDQWLLLTPTPDESDMYFLNKVTETTGTLIVWDKIDRLIKANEGNPDRAQIERLAKILNEHLSGVFYRFISNASSPVKIKINGVEVLGWDPFCTWHKETSKVSDKTFDVKSNEISKSFDFKVFILPNKNMMTAEELDKARYGLDNQGFHVYRENRLIYSGGWLNRMFVKEPHMNLIRVEISFDHTMDDMFQIDIKKSGIILPHAVREEIKQRLVAFRREAERRYRTAKRTNELLSTDQLHKTSSTAISRNIDDIVNSEIKDLDSQNGTATVRNQFGETRIKIQQDNETNLVVQAKDSLNDGVLWDFFINHEEKHGVHLNQSHEFYKRFYIPNQENAILVQAMDSVFWSLAEAELTVINQNAKRNLEELRFRVSSILRDLANELPEIKEDEENGNI